MVPQTTQQLLQHCRLPPVGQLCSMFVMSNGQSRLLACAQR